MTVQDEIADVSAKDVITIDELKAVLDSISKYADIIDAIVEAFEARISALEDL